MSLKAKAQKVVNEVDNELGISLVAYQRIDLEYLKSKLDEFLDLGIDTEDLEDSDDYRELYDLDECEYEDKGEDE